jgi:hypothetical protein
VASPEINSIFGGHRVALVLRVGKSHGDPAKELGIEKQLDLADGEGGRKRIGWRGRIY